MKLFFFVGLFGFVLFFFGCGDELLLVLLWLVLMVIVKILKNDDFGCFVGSIQVCYESVFGFCINGWIVLCLFDVGDFVGKGVLLVIFDFIDQQNQLCVSQGDLVSVEVQLIDVQVNVWCQEELFVCSVIVQVCLDDVWICLKISQVSFDQVKVVVQQVRDQFFYMCLVIDFDGVIIIWYVEVG